MQVGFDRLGSGNWYLFGSLGYRDVNTSPVGEVKHGIHGHTGLGSPSTIPTSDTTTITSIMIIYLIYIGGCQNYGPFLGTLNIRCRIIIGIQKGNIILTTTNMYRE